MFSSARAASLQGKISDKNTGEMLVGCTVYLKELKTGTVSGLDGSYSLKNIPSGRYTLICSYISYKTIESPVNVSETSAATYNFRLEPQDTDLEEITVTGHQDKSTESSARSSERNASNIINVMSARAIELSPDLDVSNVVQRMSGVTLDKNSSISGQYAILRGMDKRYNYTLINGIKIPSTNNKHRYVSLDMFPSDLVDRVEVYKSLTPDLEGDAVAGVVNLVMKDAPDRQLVLANASVGYSAFFTDHAMQSFDKSGINKKSPYELHETGYYAVPADFPTKNLDAKPVDFPVDYHGGLTWGNRFLKKRLGYIFSGSYSSFNKGKSSLLFSNTLSYDGNNLPELTGMNERIYTENQKSYGVHNKLDYRVNDRHKLQLYASYMNFATTQVRETDKTNLSTSYDPDNGTISRSHQTRLQYNIQDLINTTLQGTHQLKRNLDVSWSAVYSKAKNQTPDQATISYDTNLKNFERYNWYIDFDGSSRLWRHNSDQDMAAYLNFRYMPFIWGTKTEIKVGGLYREKKRESFYNNYTLKAVVSSKPADLIYYAEKDVDWEKYSDITWKVYNPRGSVATGETFDAHENVIAGYGMVQFEVRRLQVIGGVRVENTDQGYYMQFPIGQPRPDGKQVYTDVLPSLSLKYQFGGKHNFRGSYYRATNKPGFLEIVPCPVVEDDFTSKGNPDINHAVADNADLRWEFFPNQLDQFMVGLFYKHISDPIEYAFVTTSTGSQNIVYSPQNADKALNKGIEVDWIKYFRQLGVKANYTLTGSSITTTKLARTRDENGNIVPDFEIRQTRPLYGQAEHVGNISILYKGTNNGTNGQLSFSYTGERLYTVSQYIDNDLWQKGFWQMDFSVEKSFHNGFSMFAKARNLLNTPVVVYIKRTNPANAEFPYHSNNDKNTLVRDEYSRQSILVGIRYKFNN